MYSVLYLLCRFFPLWMSGNPQILHYVVHRVMEAEGAVCPIRHTSDYVKSLYKM